MSNGANSNSTRRPQPIVLVRGFGGLGVADEKRVAYQGFNDGTVYPQKRGENYIYEGLILRFLKSNWQYQDATNVVGYYGKVVKDAPQVPDELEDFADFFVGSKVVVDPAMALHLLETTADVARTLWVFRYYDLDDRTFPAYGAALVRLIDFIRRLAALTQDAGPAPKVNIIAHSMGGLLVREAIQRTYPNDGRRAADYVNKVVTLGTPHRGIAFQLLQDWIGIGAEEELEHFSPGFQEDPDNPGAYVHFGEHFPLDRLLTVVGTNYRTYGNAASSLANRLFALAGEFGPNYNRSDGLVKQTSAQIPGAPRTFVHKCHGGADSLVTSREAFEVATRFFFGDTRVRLLLVGAEVTRGLDRFGKSEIFLGVSIKPRRVDFDLFHQSAEAENCYGPFRERNLRPDAEVAFPMGEDGLLWEGWLDTRTAPVGRHGHPDDLVMRLDIYVGERDLLGVGFSDNVVFRKQYYLQALLPRPGSDAALQLLLHDGEGFTEQQRLATTQDCQPVERGWQFSVQGTGFTGKFRIELERVAEDGV
jgi:hypothetical protein